MLLLVVRQDGGGTKRRRATRERKWSVQNLGEMLDYDLPFVDFSYFDLGMFALLCTSFA